MRAQSSAQSSAQAAERVDGRVARSIRTRAAVVDALLALLERGELRPTVGRIAEEAGISARSVYVHFEDLDDLFAAAAQRQSERFLPLVETVPVDAPLDVRVERFTESRARLLDAIHPVRRAAVLNEPFLPALARLLAGARARERAELARVFRRELDVHAGARRRRLLAALDAVTGWPAWDTWRTQHGLTARAARQTMAESITDLLQTHEPT
jgi:TetR/AcrR family transcriptional regulator, regulator of autoinduction and epiphytic fitness